MVLPLRQRVSPVYGHEESLSYSTYESPLIFDKFTLKKGGSKTFKGKLSIKFTQ